MKNTLGLPFRLEYHDGDNGAWHFDNFSHESNTYGWRTICPFIRDNDAKDFVQKMEKKYDLLRKNWKEKPPFEIMMIEFNTWAKEKFSKELEKI